MIKIVMDNGKEYFMKRCTLEEFKRLIKDENGKLKEECIEINEGSGIYVFPKHISSISVL